MGLSSFVRSLSNNLFGHSCKPPLHQESWSVIRELMTQNDWPLLSDSTTLVQTTIHSYPVSVRLSARHTSCSTNDGRSVINLSTLDLESLFLISRAMWGSQTFMPQIGDSSNLPIVAHRNKIPPGFDFVIHDLASGQTDSSRLRFTAPDWTYRRLCEERDYRSRSSFSCALKFMVLHEIAHIVDGHTFADDLAWSNVNKTKTIEVEDQPFPHWGAEVFADRWALKKLGANLVEQSETRTIVAGLAVASFAGAIFALLLKYGSAHLRNIPHTIQQQLHPPFWFRCHEIIANTTRAGREFEAHRDLLFACLDGISRCDPLFGTLLHPIRDGEAAVAATALSSESLAELQCWKDQR